MKSSLLIAIAAASVSVAVAQALEFPKAKIPGVWLLNGTPKAPKFVLTKDGAFAYSGVGAASKGKWTFDGANLNLVWTHIDGTKLTPGTVRGKFPISMDGVLTVNKFAYKHSS